MHNAHGRVNASTQCGLLCNEVCSKIPGPHFAIATALHRVSQTDIWTHQPLLTTHSSLSSTSPYFFLPHYPPSLAPQMSSLLISSILTGFHPQAPLTGSTPGCPGCRSSDPRTATRGSCPSAGSGSTTPTTAPTTLTTSTDGPSTRTLSSLPRLLTSLLVSFNDNVS